MTPKVVPDVLACMYPGKGQRVADIKAYFPSHSEEEVLKALDQCVRNEHVEKRPSIGGDLYFKKRE